MKRPILILHGWGVSSGKYEPLEKLLRKKGFVVYIPDLPGFGKQKMLKTSMELADYVDFVRSYMRKNKIVKPVVIAHSFGGRIAVRLAAFYPKDFSKLVLTGVPIIRHMSAKKQIAYIAAFIGRVILKKIPLTAYDIIRKVLYFSIGEWDYYKSGPLSETFKKVISEDLLQYVKKITIPVFLVWGETDKLTPASDVSEISGYIANGESVVIEKYGHKLPYENPKGFLKSIENFL